MKKFSLPTLTLAVLAATAGTAFLLPNTLRAADQASKAESSASNSTSTSTSSGKPALTVQITQPTSAPWSRNLSANGSISAWQEAIISAQIGGLHLTEISVNVGDQVKRGQVLARFANESVQADLAQQQAALAEAQAALEEANANAQRASSLSTSGAISAQQIAQYQTAQKSAAARLQSAKARLQVEQIRLRQTQVLAADDGVISARSASLGLVPQQGQELFKMVRNNRLEWRAEVNANELSQLKVGLPAKLQLADGSQLEGKVRMLAPTIDTVTRNALVYVDLPIKDKSVARAGMFASGQFELGQSDALTLPQSAVVLRDGFGYVFVLGQEQGQGGRVQQVKVQVGRRQGDKLEILPLNNNLKLTAQSKVVAQGAGFLVDGDIVRVAPTKTVASTAVAK